MKSFREFFTYAIAVTEKIAYWSASWSRPYLALNANKHVREVPRGEDDACEGLAVTGAVCKPGFGQERRLRDTRLGPVVRELSPSYAWPHASNFLLGGLVSFDACKRPLHASQPTSALRGAVDCGFEAVPT